MGGNSLKWFGGIALAFLLSAGIGVGLNMQLPFAPIAASYAAKQTCSCLYVSKRTLDSCLSDFAPGDRALVSLQPRANGVRASVLLGAVSAEARFEPGYGCTFAKE